MSERPRERGGILPAERVPVTPVVPVNCHRFGVKIPAARDRQVGKRNASDERNVGFGHLIDTETEWINLDESDLTIIIIIIQCHRHTRPMQGLHL